MTSKAHAAEWQAENGRDLAARLSRIRALLQRALGRDSEPVPELPITETPSACAVLTALFGLSPFETDVLMLCAGAEMDSAIAALCAEINGELRPGSPTFGVALTVLPDAHWSALSPDAPLRRWNLISPDAGGMLTRAPLRIDERILHFLAGVSGVDTRLAGMITPAVETNGFVEPGHNGQGAMARVVPLLTSPAPPVIALFGADRHTLLAAAHAIAAQGEKALFTARASDLPTDPRERHSLARAWQREALLSDAVLLVETDGDPRTLAAFSAFAADGNFPVLLASEQPVPVPAARHVVRFPLEYPTSEDRHTAWREALGARGASLNGYVPVLAAQFGLSPTLIRAAVEDAFAGLAENAPGGELKRRLWDSCRRQARPSLDDLALRIETRHTWDDLVLPDQQMALLHDITAHVTQRRKVFDVWGFGANTRGTGTAVIFAGGSGTGKTLAAEIIANTLRLDLYRVDLSGVVSKYIGETEKNLRRIFTAAEYGGAILLFDEADALFGKRSEVRDSHDRYANIEVSYLLQQMESYRGLAILTTNMLDNFDRAFLRRVRFVVQFPFPTAEQRAAIWERVFPPEAPTDGLDLWKLARLNITGGSIRNIALNSAFLAADAGEPINMAHLLRAAAGEFSKLEMPLPDAEIWDWVSDKA
jgi:hypothetical protein